MFTAFGMPAPFLPPSAFPLSHTTLPPGSRQPYQYISPTLMDDLESQYAQHQSLVRDYHKDVVVTSTAASVVHSHTVGSGSHDSMRHVPQRAQAQGVRYDSSSGTDDDEAEEEEEEEAEDDESAVVEEEAVIAAGQRSRGAMSVRAAFDVYEDDTDQQRMTGAGDEDEQAQLDDEAAEDELADELFEEDLQYDEEQHGGEDDGSDVAGGAAAAQLDEELAYALQMQLDAEEAAVYAQQAGDEAHMAEDEEAMLVEAVRRAEEEEEQQARQTPRR